MTTRLLIGETLLNQFRVENFIGAGGMATIYRVWDLQRGVPLAMKVLHPDLGEDPAFMARFQREARALQSLSHPHIVPFYGLYRAQDLTFLLEQFVDGPSLDEILRRRGGVPLPVWEVMVYFKALYTSLGYAHAQGIIHCDVKPGNVLIDQGGHVFLTDFGIARYAEQTGSTSAIGTPIYMAPEQIRGERVSAETDIYSLGVMLFEMLTGQRPFRSEDEYPEEAGASQAERLRYAHLYLSVPNPRDINPDLPPELADVLLQALDKDPRRRYPNMQAMAEALFGAVATRYESLPGRVRPPEEQAVNAVAAGPQAAVWPENWDSSTPPPPPIRRRRMPSPRLMIALASVALVILCLLIGTRLANALATTLREGGFQPQLPSVSGVVLTPSATLAPSDTAAPGQPSSTPEATATQAPAPTQTPNPTEPQATSAPEGDFALSGQIAIIQRDGGRDRLFRIDANSSERVPMFELPEAEGSWAPQWSPDGSRLVWTSQYEDRQHVLLMEVESQEVRELPAGEIFERVNSPSWLANGEQVSFWGFNQNANWMAVADAASGELVDQFRLPVYRNLFVWDWSSGRLAFVQNTNQRYQVVISGSPMTADLPIQIDREAYAPAWSSDGQWLAFQAAGEEGSGINEIWVVRADGSELRQVTFSPAGTWSRAPTWSADSRYIGYVSDRAGSLGADYGELFAVELESSRFRQITNTGGAVYDWRPAWRP